MSAELLSYHRQREEHCRQMAQRAVNPNIRRRHEELAALHAQRMSGEVAAD